MEWSQKCGWKRGRSDDPYQQDGGGCVDWVPVWGRCQLSYQKRIHAASLDLDLPIFKGRSKEPSKHWLDGWLG